MLRTDLRRYRLYYPIADIEAMHDRMRRWRLSLALALWIGGFFLPLAIPLVIALPMPGATKAALSGLLVLGLPQLLTVVAIAIVGKSGFHELTDQIFHAASDEARARRSDRKHTLG
jgi:hypothetical protein